MKKILTVTLTIISCYNLTAQNYGSWIHTDSLQTNRIEHAAIVLADGNVLVTGGEGGNADGVLNSCEVYNVSEMSWSITTPMNIARYGHNIVRLLDNRILVIGGGRNKSCEIFDQTTETWTITDSISQERVISMPTVTLLDDGRVLITGGFYFGDESKDGKDLNICEIFDPETETWSLVDTLNIGRSEHTATKLKNGKVLVAGGFNKKDGYLSICELFDPATNKWSIIDSLNTARSEHSTILLPDGKVLVAGGYNSGSSDNPWLNSCELYDPNINEWDGVGSLAVERTNVIINFASEDVLMFAGGVHNAVSWELYDITEFRSVHLEYFPIDKFSQEMATAKDNVLLSIGGFEVDMSGGMPSLLPTKKCEIFKLGVTSVEENDNLMPGELTLYQNYPNPFNPTTIINYKLGVPSFILLKIYDVLGNEIAVLERGYKSPGLYEVSFDASNLTSGIYIYQLSTEKNTVSKKMIFIK